MEPSVYQKAILDWPTKRTGNLIVNALAGSGKTKTLELLTQSEGLVGKPTRAMSFNKSIAEELARRLPSWVESTTMHSFGFGIIRKHGWVKVNAQKLENILKFDVYDFKNDSQMTKRECYSIQHFVLRMCSLLKSHLHTKDKLPKNVVEMALNYGIDLPKDVELAQEKLQAVWQIGRSRLKVIDYDDMIYVPLAMDMLIPKSMWALVDEVQDLNPAQIALATKMGERAICVGDVHQAIYGFRGADARAMETLQAELKADSLPLNICYRCSKAVIHAAQGIVPEIEASPTANEGSVTSIRSEELIRVTKDGDFVLCRTAAPLIQHCLRFIAKGKKATVLGKEIGEGLIGLIETLDCNNVEELLMELADYEQAETERLKKREDRIVELNDTCEVIRALCEDALSIRHVVEKINSLFSKERGPGVTFSTIHKSKGLESDNVYILCPELLPHPRVKVEWMVAQEMNLKYVAITRAKRNLFWVE